MLLTICTRAIEYLFYLLFFLVPLFFLPVNYELFEFNKMVATYAITILIGGFWAIKMIRLGRISIQRTPLDIPILLFLASQIISTIVSIDVHTSVWGYYSRFNGGLASIMSYIFLYYAFVSNMSAPGVKRLLLIALASGTFVAIYGVLERLGIDKDFWVQDVQNRVFSTLGQPNWLAAYLSILIPIAIVFTISKSKDQISKIQSKYEKFFIFNMCIYYFIFTILYYITLLFTKSRSGFLGLWTGLILFFAFLLMSFRAKRSEVEESLSSKSVKRDPSTRALHLVGMTIGLYWVIGLLVFITFIIGSPFEQLNKFTLDGIRSQLRTSDFPPEADPPMEGILQTSDKPQGPALETGGTESGEIRKIVWKGAIDIAKAYPLFGAGVETFAYSYYKFRPVEHNMTSEWDFLYNKAHNEYLNYLANTGVFGLGSYLLMIGWFLWIILRKLLTIENGAWKMDVEDRKLKILPSTFYLQSSIFATSLLAGYISILVSNFFGFSVVIINLFFFLIPAFVFVLNGQLDSKRIFLFPSQKSNQKLYALSSMPSTFQWIGIVFILLTSYFLLLFIFRMWDADRTYALGKNLNKSGDYSQAYPYLVAAIAKRAGEPQFSDELSINTAALAIAMFEQNESTLAAQLVNEAIRHSDYIVKKGPNNPNYWRSRIRVFYALSQIDPTYEEEAIRAAKKALELAPTDPKVAYNYGLILGQGGNLDEAIAVLEKTIMLKPNYRDPIYALALFYHEKATDTKGDVINQDLQNRAIAQMEAVLQIASADAEASEKLRQWRGY